MAPNRYESATKGPKTLRTLTASAPEGPPRMSTIAKRPNKARRMGTLPRRVASKRRLSAFEMATATFAGAARALALELQEVHARFEAELRSLAPLTTSHVTTQSAPRAIDPEEPMERLEQESQRLVALLAETERQRDEARAALAAMKQARGASPLPQRPKATSGPSSEDAQRDAKMAIIKELLEQNRELRRALASSPAPSDPPATSDAATSAPDVDAATTSAPSDAASATAGDASSLSEPAASATADDTSSPSEPAEDPADEPLVNPDDMPWQAEGQAASADAGAEIKVIRDFKQFEPPPLDDKQNRAATPPRSPHGRRKRR